MTSNYTSLVAAFSKLLQQTDDLDTLNVVGKLVTDRIQVVSSSEESDSGGKWTVKKKKKRKNKKTVDKVGDLNNNIDSDRDDFNNYVKYIPEVKITEQSFTSLFEELKAIKFINNINR